jgi:predicted RNA-binding Zn-ribbon protein involved in translation (DUF1610 family)
MTLPKTRPGRSNLAEVAGPAAGRVRGKIAERVARDEVVLVLSERNSRSSSIVLGKKSNARTRTTDEYDSDFGSHHDFASGGARPLGGTGCMRIDSSPVGAYHRTNADEPSRETPMGNDCAATGEPQRLFSRKCSKCGRVVELASPTEPLPCPACGTPIVDSQDAWKLLMDGQKELPKYGGKTGLWIYWGGAMLVAVALFLAWLRYS